MKTIALVQPNFRQGPKEINAYYLPYSVGVLWAYASQFESITDSYRLTNILWKRDLIEDIIDDLTNVDVIAFSTYVWNKNYNYKLAKLIKERNPQCVTIFGGPEIEIENKNLFEKYPFMDYVVKTEGEYVFKELLENFDNAENIPGLLINKDKILIDTGNAKRIDDLNSLPSPYLAGVFDILIEQNPTVEWNATLETNRGCPYACTFCDWGSLTYSKVKKFNLERVYAELEWIAKNKCGFVSVTDANFGIFLERDNLIADRLLEVQEKYGYPYTFSVTWAKNQKDGVIDIVKKLTDSPKFNQGLTVSVQSMDLKVLENIKRKNLNQHKIEEIFKICEERKIPTYTEVILGLPGETLESWKNNFWELFNAGAHTGLNIFQAQLLENAEMNLAQTDSFKMTHQVVYDYMSGSYDEDPIKEGVKVVTSTKNMSFEEMLDAQIFSWYLNTLHVNGLTNYISRFLNKYKGITYKEFYENLYVDLSNDEWFNDQIKQTRFYYNKWMTEGKIDHPKIAGVEIHGWNLIHRTILSIHTDNKTQHLFNLIKRHLDKLLTDVNLANELYKFQRHYFIDFNDIQNYPKTLKFKYDFLGDDLNTPIDLIFDFPEDKEMKQQTFLENIYFRRRRNFGKASIS
jgi:radical SAM superfamily enzyme YgiQ (UPF0313 family)